MATHLADEPALVLAAQLGNQEAFSVLVRQYHKSIYRLAFKITGNHEDAEDSLQEGLLKAYCNLKGFQRDSRFYTWLVRITINEALMKLRKRRSDRQLPLENVSPNGENAAPKEFEDKRANPERLCEELELNQALSEALEGMSPRLCHAFVLRNVEDFTVKETADMLGLSVAAVKSRLLRARGRLRRRLQKAAQGGGIELRVHSRPRGSSLRDGVASLTERYSGAMVPGSRAKATGVRSTPVAGRNCMRVDAALAASSSN